MLEEIVTWAEIDLDAIAHNVRAFTRHVGDSVEVIAVVKANAYGHGAVPVAQVALEAGATRLAVHRTSECIQLRRAGITAPILVMGYTPPSGAASIVRHDLTPSPISRECADAIAAEAVRAGRVVPVHVKVDTGLGRYGLLPGEVEDFVRYVGSLCGVRLEGLYTHLATADAEDRAHAGVQIEAFGRLLAILERAGVRVPLRHVANSAAMLRLPEAHFDAVRPGIAMYGLAPSDHWAPTLDLRPALTLKSRVSRVRELPSGSGISYGRTFVTTRPMRVALVPAGYGDGYHRVLSNRGSVLIHGQRAPILGRVCMDQFVVDVDGIPDVRTDDEVVLIGSQGSTRIPAEEVARLAGTINYEVTTSLAARVTRVFLRGGEVVGVSDVGDGLTPKVLTGSSGLPS